MNRFNILLGKKAPEVEKTASQEQVEVFSPEKELSEWGIRCFRAQAGEIHRIHILRPDMNSMDNLFCGAQVHFFNRFFVCQSPKSSALDPNPSSPPAPCCTMKYDGNIPGWRICALIYDYDERCLKYWIFKKNTFNKLKKLSTSLITNFLPDFNVRTEHPRFQQLVINPCKTFRLSRDKVRLAEVCQQAAPFLIQRKNRVASDMNLDEIVEYLKSHGVTE